MAWSLALSAALLVSLTHTGSGGDPGHDPCKTTDNGYSLICSNITSQFFTSTMFFSLDDDIARFTSELRLLEIRQSEITRLETVSFKHMPHLSYLIASNVSLQEIDRGAFEGLSRLKMADLSHNELERIPVDAFRDTRISHLDLEGNTRLQIPTNGAMLNAKRLRSLILKNCNLQHLSGSAFGQIPGLAHLDLSGNKLEQLPRDVFHQLEHLDFLDLSDNRFRTIDSGVFTSIPLYPNLPTSVLLAGNPWSCDCRIASVITWATQNGNTWTNVATISRLRKRTECHGPSRLRGISWNDNAVREMISTC